MLRPLSFNKNEEDQKMMAALSTMQQRGQQDDTQKKLKERIAQQLLQTYSPPEQVTLENLGQGFEEGFIPGVVDSAAQIGNYLINNPQGKQISAALLADSNPYLAQGLYQSGLQDAKSYAQAQNQAGALNQRQTQLGMQYLKDLRDTEQANLAAGLQEEKSENNRALKGLELQTPSPKDPSQEPSKQDKKIPEYYYKNINEGGIEKRYLDSKTYKDDSESARKDFGRIKSTRETNKRVLNSIDALIKEAKDENGEVKYAMTELGEAVVANNALEGAAESFGRFVGTPRQKNAYSHIERIKANLGFGELQNMRNNSPTGGALGTVSDAETNFLQKSASALDAGKSPEEMIRDLLEIKQSILRLESDLPNTQEEILYRNVGEQMPSKKNESNIMDGYIVKVKN